MAITLANALKLSMLDFVLRVVLIAPRISRFGCLAESKDQRGRNVSAYVPSIRWPSTSAVTVIKASYKNGLDIEVAVLVDHELCQPCDTKRTSDPR